MSICVVESGGAISAAGLFVETRGIVEYHLSGADEAFADGEPTTLTIHFVQAWARNRGNSYRHLGAGVGGVQDSPLRFKSGFWALRRPFRTLRIVVLAREYARLVSGRDPSMDPGMLGGFFSLYREASAPFIQPSAP
jgi:Acetyltransferase (GNAT) domain